MNDPITTWALRENVPLSALPGLYDALAQLPEPAGTGGQATTESGVLTESTARAFAAGHWLLRNNSGMLRNDRGQPVRFGLGNTSAAVNRVIKSSDLIGIRRELVTPEMVGTYIGRFWAVEGKKPGWTHPVTERDRVQAAFGRKVESLGGRFQFVSDVGQLAV